MEATLLANSNDRRLRNPTSLILDSFGGTAHKGSRYNVRPYFSYVNISFHVLDISRFLKKLVWVSCRGWGGGGVGVHVGCL